MAKRPNPTEGEGAYLVRNNYKVGTLPEDLQGNFQKGTTVRVIVEAVPQAPSRELLMELVALARRVEPIGDDPVERIRQLRDEWED